MSYCINPKCKHHYNQDDSTILCEVCDTPLLIQKRYRLREPLRDLDERSNTKVFVVDDVGREQKVLKVLQNLQLLTHFEREAQTLKRLHHPGIIPRVEPDGYFIFELNNGEKLYCLVMEKLEGQNLEQWLENNEWLNPETAVNWLKQLIEILNILHENNLFHRDIKLSNILLKPDQQLALIDFGAVRKVTDTYLSKLSTDREITSIVSPGYSPLEQINGKAVPQSDFYALGCCFVHLLTGVHPLNFSEDEQTGKLIWYDSDCKAETWLTKLIDYLIVPPSSKQLLTGVHPPNFSEDKQTSKPTSLDASARQVPTWLAKLIDYLIEPVQFKRPFTTKEILHRLEIEKEFLEQQLRQERLRRITKLLYLLNIMLLISVPASHFLFYLYDKHQWDNNQQSNNTKQVMIYNV